MKRIALVLSICAVLTASLPAQSFVLGIGSGFALQSIKIGASSADLISIGLGADIYRGDRFGLYSAVNIGIVAVGSHGPGGTSAGIGDSNFPLIATTFFGVAMKNKLGPFGSILAAGASLDGCVIGPGPAGGQWDFGFGIGPGLSICSWVSRSRMLCEYLSFRGAYDLLDVGRDGVGIGGFNFTLLGGILLGDI